MGCRKLGLLRSRGPGRSSAQNDQQPNREEAQTNEKPGKDAERMTVDDFAAECADLVPTIGKWNLEASLSLCAGLLLCPRMHAYTYAIEILSSNLCPFYWLCPP